MPFLLLMISCQENKRYDSKSKEIIKTELSCKTKDTVIISKLSQRKIEHLSN